MTIPAYFVTNIHLSLADRLRVLFHGHIIYRAEIEPDPGDFDIVNVRVRVPYIRKGDMPKIGYEQIRDGKEALAREEA